MFIQANGIRFQQFTEMTRRHIVRFANLTSSIWVSKSYDNLNLYWEPSASTNYIFTSIFSKMSGKWVTSRISIEVCVWWTTLILENHLLRKRIILSCSNWFKHYCLGPSPCIISIQFVRIWDPCCFHGLVLRNELPQKWFVAYFSSNV